MKAPIVNPVSRNDAIALAALVGAILMLFVDRLVAADSQVLSHLSGDTSQFFTRMRDFGFSEIRAGRLPLWNPYLMGGTPFVGNFQSALFYPLNLLYVAFPVERAVNLDYTLHFILASVFLFAWCRGRRISPAGAAFAGFVFVCSAPFSLRMLAGHLTMVQSMAWAPLLLLAVDKVFESGERRTPRLGWVLLGIGATTMQILAGHPQTVFITGFTVALYCGLRIVGASNRLPTIAALLSMGMAPLLLAAVQLLPGLQTMGESLRSGGTDEGFATSFSFPPENLITLFAPAFFSDRVHAQYWGSWAIWDACFFMGIVALSFAVLGARSANSAERRYAPFLAFLLLLLAMGRYTPVYDLFALIPVFSVLRGPSKFLFAVMLFMSLLAGIGFDRLRDSACRVTRRRTAAALFGTGAALALATAAVAIAARSPYEASPWRELLRRQLWYNYFDASFFAADADYFVTTSQIAMISLAIGAVTCAIGAGFLWRVDRSRAVYILLIVVGVVEVGAFARVYRVTFDHDRLHHAPAEALYTRHRGDFRVMHLAGDESWMRNHPMWARQGSVWGYEPVILKRYGTLMARAAGGDYPHLGEMQAHARFGSSIFEVAIRASYFDLHEDPVAETVDLPTMLDIARCRYVIVPEGMPDVTPGIYENPEALPRFLLLRDYVVLKQGMAALQALDDFDFDPRRTVILESPPDPAPAPSAGEFKGTVDVEEQSSDHMVLRIELDEPAVLLVTDPYSEGWKISALPDSVQQSYRIVPADFAFRGVALEAGAHHLRMEYLPDAFVLGRAISLGGLGVYFAAVAFWVVRRYRAKKAR